MQDERQLHLTGGEEFPDHLHASQQHVIDDHEGFESAGHGGIEIGLEVLTVTIDDPLAEELLDGPVAPVLLHHFGGLNIGEHVEQRRKGVVAFPTAVVDEIQADLSLIIGNAIERHDPGCVHNCRVQAGLHTLGEEHRVQDMACRRLETE